MTILFVSSRSEIPDQYDITQQSSPESVNYRGKEYELVGTIEKEHSIASCAWVALCALIQALFPIACFSVDINRLGRDWQIITTGKETIEVYCCEKEDLEEIDLQTDAKGKQVLNVSSKEMPHTEDVDQKQPGSPVQAKSLSPKAQALSLLPEVPQSSTSLVNNFADFETVIARLAKGNGAKKKKAALFQKGLDLFKKNGCVIELEAFTLNNRESFKVNDKSTLLPSYFKEVFNSSRPWGLETTPAYYNYNDTPDVDDIWVDFANAVLGGGCFSVGFVQEEIMVAEMPDFAAHIAEHSKKRGYCDILTREGNSKDRNRVMKGSPNPYLLKGVHRVQEVNNSLAYGSKLETLSQQKLLESTKELDNPQKVNVLAIAAPKLFSKNPFEQWHPSTLIDNFNTLMAGFTLVLQEKSIKPPFIHSGRIGCGVFSNDIHAIYLLHCLAAQHLGIKVKMHGYSHDEGLQFQKSWENVAPELVDKTLEECMQIISKHLKKKK